eukprot:10000205-Ditylum_brightwellii.AAC.1
MENLISDLLMKLRDEINPPLPRTLSGAVNMGGPVNANDDKDKRWRKMKPVTRVALCWHRYHQKKRERA